MTHTFACPNSGKTGLFLFAAFRVSIGLRIDAGPTWRGLCIKTDPRTVEERACSELRSKLQTAQRPFSQPSEFATWNCFYSLSLQKAISCMLLASSLTAYFVCLEACCVCKEAPLCCSLGCCYSDGLIRIRSCREPKPSWRDQCLPVLEFSHNHKMNVFKIQNSSFEN